jgi:hypothetical protein
MWELRRFRRLHKSSDIAVGKFDIASRRGPAIVSSAWSYLQTLNHYGECVRSPSYIRRRTSMSGGRHGTEVIEV